MATLNGAEFEIIEIEWSTYQNNVIQEILGSDTVEVQHQGYGSDPVRIKGMVNNEKELDLFKGQFYSGPMLILVTDPNSNKEYPVYALGDVKKESVTNRIVDPGIVFDCVVQLKYPYADSVFEISQTKRIISQTQEWSQDDSGKYIKVEGSADSLTDIEVTGRKAGSELDTNPVGEPSFETITGWSYAEVDTNTKISGERTDAWKYHGSYSYRIRIYSGSAVDDYGQVSRTVDFTNIDMFSVLTNISQGSGKGDLEIYVDGDLLGSFSDLNGVERLYIDTSEYTGSLTLLFRHVVTATDEIISLYLDDIVSYAYYTDNLSIYNMADPTTKCIIANRILDTAVHIINADGTGSVEYADDFLTKKYLAATAEYPGVGWSSGELGLSGTGHITWFFDSKYAISEIPVFTSRIYKFIGTPTIQISLDNSTWYDIKTAVVNDVETDYDLEATNLDLRGVTSFYVRIRAESGVISVIKSMAISILIHTIYAKNIKLTSGGAVNTFKCIQDSLGEDLFDVRFIFKYRWWI